MISEKLMEKPWMFWRVWKAFAANNFTLGGGSYEPILYDDLVALIAGEDLVVGKKYLITDFKTTFTLNISGDPYTDASVEGIVVTALTDASLEPIAYSISHPKDILYYDVDGTTYMPGSTKGCIYRRIDTEKNISVPFDFREFKVEYRNINDAEAYDVGATYNRGKIVKESGNYYISKVSSNLGNSLAYTEYWLPAGANLNFFSGEFEFINLDGAISFSGEASSAYPCFTVAGSSNFVIEGQPTLVSETLFFINGTVVDCKFEKIEKCYFNSLLSNTTGGILKYIISQGNTLSGNTLGNIQRALEVSKEVGQKIFIEQTELFNKELNKLLDNLQDKFSNVADNVSDVSREFLGYVSVKAYIDELESLKNEVSTKEANKQAIQKRLDSLNLGLIFNDLAGSNGNLVSQLELLKSNPATKDNYIIKYFTVKENIIDTKSFVKESNETISLLIDSVKSLYFDNKTQLNDSGLTPRDFVDNMLSYLMVKDNMQFKNNSVAKYLPVNMFSKYSNTLDELVKGLVTKNTSMNFAEVGYNFRKMYVTDINTSYGAMQTIKLDPKDNTPIRLNGENLEFAIDTTTEDGLKESSATLSKIFSKLDVKTKVKTWPAFKFPQFIKVRIGNDQYKVYELDSFTNNAKGFTNKKDNFLNYIDASQGVKHNLENAYAAGEKATYKPLDQIGVKDVSAFFPGTYDKAKVLFDQVKPEEVNTIPSVTKPGKFTSIEDMGKPTTPIEQSVKVNPYAMTSELANDVSTEVNASEVTLPEEKPLKVEEKDVTLDAKKNLLAMVNSQELFIEGKEFTEAQYQKLKDRINAAKTMNELMALEENITKCM